MLKITVPEIAYPKQVHGAIYSAIRNDYHNKKPMFSIYVNGHTEMMFLDDDDGIAVWDAIQANKFIMGNVSVKNAMVESVAEISEIPQKTTDRITLSFLSPTTFKKRHIHMPLPDPVNVFKGAAELLSVNAPDVIILDMNIKTQKIAISHNISVTGFVGTCTFKCKDLKFLYPAARILEYTGVGWKPALGMGKVKIGRSR